MSTVREWTDSDFPIVVGDAKYGKHSCLQAMAKVATQDLLDAGYITGPQAATDLDHAVVAECDRLGIAPSGSDFQRASREFFKQHATQEARQ